MAKPIKKPQNRKITDQNPDQPHKRPDQTHKLIVSSSHLVSEKAVELSEVEYGLIVASNAFGMWIIKAMSVALAEMEQSADLGVLDILCLHSVNHRGRAKKLADICFKLNVGDSHTVNYALTKLVKNGLLQTEKQGKEVFYGSRSRGRRYVWRIEMYANLVWSMNMPPLTAAVASQMRQVYARLRASLDSYLGFMIKPPIAPPVFKQYDLDNICRGSG